MKRLAIFLCIAVAILVLVTILTGRLEAAIAAVGLGGGGAGAIANARKAQDKAAEVASKKLENMTDEEIVATDPDAQRAVDDAVDSAGSKLRSAFGKLKRNT